MSRVLAVSIAPHGRLFLLDSADSGAMPGDSVLVSTASGPKIGRCACVIAVDGVRLPACIGVATEADRARDEEHRARRAEILAVAPKLIAAHGLPMTVVGVDYVERGEERRAVLYFKAPKRVDYRALLPELARVFGTRVEMRQVSARDIAALVGGVGPCGRELCCALVGAPRGLVRPARGAEDGICGRARCCANYEEGRFSLLPRRRRQ